MQFDSFDLLARVLEGHRRAALDLSSSDMPGLRLSDYDPMPDLLLAENAVGGSEPLRAAIARIHGGRAEEYLVTAGASEANFAVCAALLEKGSEVLVEHPTYQPLEAIPRGLGARVRSLVRSESEGFPLTADAVEHAADSRLRLLVLTNLNNPTGIATEPADVHRIADLAAERGFYVLVDEIFREMAFDRDVPTMGGLNDHTIVTSSVSKFYGAGGLKIGWLRAAPAVRARVQHVLDYLSAAPAAPSEAIALSVLRNRDRTVARNRRLVEEGRKVAREWAENEPGVTWYESDGHLRFPKVGGDTVHLAEILLEKHGTFIAPGESFGVPGHFRLNVGIGAERVAEGLARVSKARSSLRGM